MKIVVEKDAANRIPMDVDAARRELLAQDFAIYDVQEDGRLLGPYGPLAPRTDEGVTYRDSLGARRQLPDGQAAALQRLTPYQFAYPAQFPELMSAGSQAALVVYRGKFWHTNATDNSAGTGWVYAGGGYWETVTGPITLAAHDSGSMWRMSAAGTITIPAGLTLPPSLVVVPPASGDLSIAVSGGATINGGTTTLTRTRGLNPCGVAIVSYGGDAYGLSGCAT